MVHFTDGCYLVNLAFGRYVAPLKLNLYNGPTQLSFVGVDMFAPSTAQSIISGLKIQGKFSLEQVK
jgi:hypothetical protein